MKPEDAIQEEVIEDVSVEEETTGTDKEIVEEEPVVSEHARMLEELADKKNQERNPEPEVVEEESPEVTEVIKEPEEEKISIKVDGEVQEVPLSKIMDAGTRALQKESAADKRLEEATQLLKDAQGVTTQPPIKDVATDTEDADEFINKTVEAIQYGDEDDVKEAISGLLKRTSEQAKQNVPPINVAEAVSQQLAMTSINAELSKEYDPDNEDSSGCSDLLGHPTLRQALKERVDQKIAKGSDGREISTYREAAKEIRGEFMSIFNLKPETKSNQSPDTETRVERKRQITTVNVAAGKVETKPKEKSKTPSQIVEEMAARRGQII